MVPLINWVFFSFYFPIYPRFLSYHRLSFCRISGVKKDISTLFFQNKSCRRHYHPHHQTLCCIMQISNTSFDLTQICLRRTWDLDTSSSSSAGGIFSRHHLLSYWKDKPTFSLDLDLDVESIATLKFLLPYLILLIFFFLLLSKFSSSTSRYVKQEDD